MKDTTLSKIGQQAGSNAARVDLKIYFEALENLYDSVHNPEGSILLNMAENKQSWPELRDKIRDIQMQSAIPDWIAGYTSTRGHPFILQIIADFLSTFLAHTPISPDHLAISAGATGVIEVTTLALAERGDVAVFPAPSYPVYELDVGAIAGLERFNLVTHNDLDELADGPLITPEILDNTLLHLTSQNKRFRMLVLTHPDNPTGMIYSKRTLKEIAAWCIKNEIHLVVNEIYALSVINTGHPEISHLYRDPEIFTSFAQVMAPFESPFLHLWYAFSKDFGISGFRIGLLYSRNSDLLNAYSNLNLGHLVSNFTQWILGQLLSDFSFLKNYLALSGSRLTESYITVVKTAERLKLPFVPAYGSLFVWIDFSEFLENQTWEAEEKFWLTLYENTGILLTPGKGFGHRKKGQFRIVHTNVPKRHLEVAMKKLEIFLTDQR